MIVRRSVHMRSSPTILVISMLALLAALLVLPLTLAPRAEAFVYWADQPQHAIGRANLDGTGVDELFISGILPTSVAVDGRYIYWGGFGPASDSWAAPAIARANLDGTQVNETFIPEVFAEDIAVDDDHIYWADVSEPGIGRANLDGTGVERGFIPGFDPGASVTGIAVDANHIYWGQTVSDAPGSTAAIGRANLDGSGVDHRFITGAGFPGSVAVNAAHVYWISAGIGRANLDGTGVDQGFIEGVPQMSLEGLAVDAGHIYGGEGGYPMAEPIGSVGRADLDGGNVDHGFITPAPPAGPVGVAVNFSLGKLKLDKERGTGKLTVEVPAAGEVALARTAKVKGVEVGAEAAGKVRLAIEPWGRAKKKLAEQSKAKVKVKVTYTPDSGEPSTQTTALKLIERG